MTKATPRYSEYVILVVFLWQKRLRERASMLRYTYKIVLHNKKYRNDRTNKKNQGRIGPRWKMFFGFFHQDLKICALIRKDWLWVGEWLGIGLKWLNLSEQRIYYRETRKVMYHSRAPGPIPVRWAEVICTGFPRQKKKEWRKICHIHIHRKRDAVHDETIQDYQHRRSIQKTLRSLKTF